MIFKFYPIIVGFILTAQSIQGQDFEQDTIYYTPIPKTQIKKTSTKKIPDDLENDRLIAYFFNFQFGPLIGCADCSKRKEVTFTTSTIHGVSIGRKLRTGLGLGLDTYYSWMALPMFGSISWDLYGTKNTNALFVQLDYGWSKPSLNNSTQNFGYKSTNVGRMLNAQIGYRVKYHDLKMSFAIGSKSQRATANFEYPTYYYGFDGSPIQGPPDTKKIRQDMNRFMFSMAIGWK